MKLLRLFGEMLLLSASVLGGGYVILTVADERFSRKLKWLQSGELFEMLPLFQMVPGIVGGHTAIYVGHRVAGLVGSLVALAGIVLPSVAIFLAVSVAYRYIPIDHPLMKAAFLGLRAALAGLLADMVLRTWKKSVGGPCGCLAVVASVLLLEVGRVPAGWVIVAAMVLGVVIEGVRRRMAKGDEGGESRVFRSFWAIPLLFMGYGLMAFGGGFVLVPVYLRDFVGAAAPYLQLTPNDFANVMALTEMTPGPVAVNCATFFGYELGSCWGAVVATFSLVLPGSFILLLALASVERFKTSVVVRGVFVGVRPVTTALLACATWSFLGMSVWQQTETSLVVSPLALAIAGLSLWSVRSRRIGAVVAILLSALVAVVLRHAVPDIVL